MKLTYRTVFISDTHLGSRGAQARDLARFLRCLDCEKLYLVGDIIDLWRIRTRPYWKVEHNEVVRQVIAMVEGGIDVRFVPGNHDECAREYCGLEVGGVLVQMDDVHETADGRRLLVTHGDQFDMVVRHSPLLALIGSKAYEILLGINRVYNGMRRLAGLEYWSLAQFLKPKVKSACTFVSRFEEALALEAKRRGLDGVVCGHIHKAELRVEPSFTYYNCGDWIESCTAVVEHHDGAMEVIHALPAIAEMVRRQKRLEQAAAGHAAFVAALDRVVEKRR